MNTRDSEWVSCHRISTGIHFGSDEISAESFLPIFLSTKLPHEAPMDCALKRLTDLPAMPKRVHNGAVTPSVFAVLHGGANHRAGTHGLIEHGIRVVYD
jgi:hypothetical protein